MMFSTFTSIRPLLGAALLAFAAGTASAQAPEKFTFALNWFAVGDHAAYWVALEKGYFAQRGLVTEEGYVDGKPLLVGPVSKDRQATRGRVSGGSTRPSPRGPARRRCRWSSGRARRTRGRVPGHPGPG